MRSIEEPSKPVAAASPGFLLVALGQAAGALYRESFKDSGLKPPHVATLNALRFDAISQQALSEATGLDPVKLVGILNDLEASGLVERRRNLVDRRRHNVAVTAAGLARIADIERLTRMVEDRLFGGLTPDQRTQLGTLLELLSASSDVGGCPDGEASAACPGTTESTDIEPGCGAV